MKQIFPTFPYLQKLIQFILYIIIAVFKNILVNLKSVS